MQGAPNTVLWRHDFSIFVRAWEKTSFGTLCWLLTEGIPLNSVQKLLHAVVHPACEAMDVELPRAVRNVLLVGDGKTTIDYFEFKCGLVERSDIP